LEDKVLCLTDSDFNYVWPAGKIIVWSFGILKCLVFRTEEEAEQKIYRLGLAGDENGLLAMVHMGEPEEDNYAQVSRPVGPSDK